MKDVHPVLGGFNDFQRKNQWVKGRLYGILPITPKLENNMTPPIWPALPQHKELTREEDYALKCTCNVKGRLAQVIVPLELNLASMYMLCIPLRSGALDS
jgi:hypothetical protein